MSFKPEDLSPLAGIAIPTMLQVILDEADDHVEAFDALKATQRHVELITYGTAAAAGITIIQAVSNSDYILLTAEFGILTAALYLCRVQIEAVKWWMLDTAKAFHDAAAQIIKEYYGVDPDGQTGDTATD